MQLPVNAFFPVLPFLPLLTSLSSSPAKAWKFEFPHGGGESLFNRRDQKPLSFNRNGDDDDDVDIVTGSQFNGLRTFANLPYVNCFTDRNGGATTTTKEAGIDTKDRYDIAILGAPFDTTVTARPGARYGPAGIRTGSQRIDPEFSWNIYTGRNPLKSWATIVDCGDVPLTWLDNNMALAQLDKAHKVVSGRIASNESTSTTPRIIALGGDHTTTLSALRSTYQRWGKVSVIHFDSHIDTWDPAVLGGDISNYAGLNHGTFLHIAHEEGLIHNTSSIHAGIRAPLSSRRGDLRNDLRCGFQIITARDLDRFGASGVASRIKDRVGEEDPKVYVSVDIDVLDPAFAPATGTAEPAGWSTRELLAVLDDLVGLQVVGADVVEVAPIYDNPGETTVLAAAQVALSLVELMVETPVKSLADRAKAQKGGV